MSEEFLWVEKYRPSTIEDCVLPDVVKETFGQFLVKGEIPNLLLSGTAGTGKTTSSSTPRRGTGRPRRSSRC